MDRKLFTLLEIAVIAGLILLVMYLGGVFKIDPAPTPPPPTDRDIQPALPTATRTRSPTATRRPTRTPSPTPVLPPLTQPSGRIAFESTRDGNSEIYVVDADGRNLINLTHDPAGDYFPTWSPDGQRLAFLSDRTGWLELYVMNAEGGDVKQLTHTFGTRLTYFSPPAWSPDGRQLAAIRTSAWWPMTFGGREPPPALIDLIQADGSGTTQVFESNEAWVLARPNWSPSGEYVAFMINGPLESGIKLVKVTESPSTSFTPTPALCERSFAWAPSADRLVCITHNNQIISLALDGSERQAITKPFAASYLWGLSLAPDGQRLLYLAHDTLTTIQAEDASEPVSFASPLRESWPFDSNVLLSWSPDSQWITYQSQENFNQADIYIANIYDGAHPLRLTDSGNNHFPQWQPAP